MAVFFYSGKHMESKIIYCPKCGRKVATWDGRSKINIVVNCRNCYKRIVYNVDSGETAIKNIDKRNTSSGMTIY